MKGQHVLVLGLGASGLAMTRWCLRQGAQVTVADTRDEPPQRAALPEGVRFKSGPFAASLVEADTTCVLRSPGLAPATLQAVLQEAQRRNVRVCGELDLFTQALAELKEQRQYAPAVLAITGTNGKTTVTSLTAHLVQRAGLSVTVAGNIGPTLLDTLHEKLQADALPQVWVLELSSFQLDAAHAFQARAATVLNITQDHLDWHGDMAAYAAAKRRILERAEVMVLSRDDAQVMAMQPPAEPATGRGAARAAPRPWVTFGADLPRRPGDFGMESVNGMNWLVRAHEADEARPKKTLAAEEIHLQRLMPADALRIRGRHNALNALAALALGQAAGCPLAAMLYGLREYRGEPHRMQPIGVVEGVEYFDDSKGTNVGATVAALQGLGADRRVVVLLGGDGKGQDFAPLAQPLAQYARAAVLFGRDAPLIRAALASCGVPLFDAADMPQAVALARQAAQSGDAVLLSPACASLDMFRDYAHRARVFVQSVQTLAEEAGQTLELSA